jgi:UDP-2-acetamido-3-amino-2,3-dideoxy-glucuronate N-acetyltransferase
MSDFFVHDSSYIDADVTIGKDTKIWHFSHIMAHTTIGDNCSFGQNCVVGPNVVIGNNVKVQNNISIYEGVEVEDDVFIGPSVVFTNVINPRSFIVRKQEFRKTLLKKGVSIGANATIICGNTLGEYAFIGSGTVVTKDVPNFALVVGNPGRRIGWVSRVGHMLTFNEKQVATCPETGETYQLKEDEVVAL